MKAQALKVMALLALVLLMGEAIKIPVEQGQFRCMLIYSMGGDETIKIDINFPQIEKAVDYENSAYYHLTLRNTKTH